mmetsp:Transcript_3338/g.3368  ORF Transcript_3338/g.3368 Transcript_3338/m.3368 type:complete len:132 (-) Transcript_3338:384-779(-)
MRLSLGVCKVSPQHKNGLMKQGWVPCYRKKHLQSIHGLGRHLSLTEKEVFKQQYLKWKENRKSKNFKVSHKIKSTKEKYQLRRCCCALFDDTHRSSKDLRKEILCFAILALNCISYLWKQETPTPCNPIEH